MPQLKRLQYDYIFLGTGCATLSLLMRMLRSGEFSDKHFLLVDKDGKKSNDRTWCYWEKGPGFFEDIVYKKWPTVSFISNDFTSELNIAPYVYKMIRGIDLYEYCFAEIGQRSNVEFVQATVDDWEWNRDGLTLTLDGQIFSLGDGEVFNSIYKPDTSQTGVINLLQHFKGWMIETEHPSFDPALSIMMDFRVHQDYGTSFGYVLSLSENRAMIEYTQFTRQLLKPEEYIHELKNYIENILDIKEYKILEEEFGVIPMTSERFHFAGKGWNLGTAGGQTKGSSGYTFQFIQKSSDIILSKLTRKEPLTTIKDLPARFRFYDNVLLHILYHEKLKGDKIFSTLFRRNKPQQVLRFLDNESSWAQELKIISTLPTWPFFKAAVKVVS